MKSPGGMWFMPITRAIPGTGFASICVIRLKLLIPINLF